MKYLFSPFFSLFPASSYQFVQGAAIRDHRPDVIVVNAARAAVAPFGPIIMGLEDIEKVLAAAPEATVIASHMDNVGHATVWRKDIREFIARNGTAGRLLVPEDGETCCI